MSENPFETDEQLTAGEAEQIEDGDIETPEFEEDVETVEASDEDVEVVPAEPTTGTVQAQTKAPARPVVPEGFITPVQFAKELTDRERKAGRIAEGEVIAPQVIYSYVNQGKKAGADPVKTLRSYSEGGRENLLKREEAFAYWDAKAQRVQDRKDAKAAKEKAAAEKAAAAAKQPAPAPVEAEAASEPVTEVE
jgi:hypothetical protein